MPDCGNSYVFVILRLSKGDKGERPANAGHADKNVYATNTENRGRTSQGSHPSTRVAPFDKGDKNLSLRGARKRDAAISKPQERLLRFARNDKVARRVAPFARVAPFDKLRVTRNVSTICGILLR